jgi:hypothetical protein
MGILFRIVEGKAFVTKWIALAFLCLPLNELLSQARLGLQIGRSYSMFHVENSGQLKFYDLSQEFDHQGLLANASFSYFYKKNLGFDVGLGYVKRGTVVLRDYGIVGYDKFSLNYINLSLLLSASPCKFFRVNGGISPNYLVSAVAYWGKNKSANTTEFYERFDIGFKTGLTISIKNITLNANYFHSFKKARSIELNLPIPGNPVEEKNGYYNRSIEFSLGYQLDLKKKVQSKN